MSSTDINALITATEGLNWIERLQLLAVFTQGKTVFSTSFSFEDQAITHAIAEHQLPISLFTLDTGRHFEETYAVQHETTQRYGLPIRTLHPDPLALEKYVAEHGVNGFYESRDNRKLCCFIRKVEPLGRALEGAEIWVSGLRREHSDFRQDLPVAEWDEKNQVIKFYPLLDTTTEEVRDYIEKNNVPYNVLHDKGYPSIGCAPCTRAVEPGEHPRAGRWWWEQGVDNECGLHVVNGKLVRIKSAPEAGITHAE